VEEVEIEVVENPYIDAMVDLASQVGAILTMYPVETILNRLIVQGTRTIIDNTDTGYGVVPINTRYDGFLDCAQSIAQTEGVIGFYKGVGTIVFQAVLTYTVIKLAKSIATRVYDSEWSMRSDMNTIKNLMTANNNSLNPNI
jgi:solute carrier family 25 protein 46